MSNTVKLLISLGFALGLGLITSVTKNPVLLDIAKWIEPVGAIWIGFLRMTILPLVIALLINTMAATNMTRGFAPLIKKTALVFLALNGLMIIVTLLVVPPLLNLIPSAATVPIVTKIDLGENVNAPLSFVDQLINWIPVNPFKSAAEGAILPLIIFSILLGLALNRVDDTPKKAVLLFFRGIGDAMLVIVRWLFVVAPVAIFAVVFPLISQVGAGLVGALVYYVVIRAINAAACIGMLYAAAILFGRQPVRRFVTGSLQPQFIVIGTQSSVATLPAMVTAAEDRLKISTQVTSTVLPLAVSVFRAGSIGGLIIYALFTAHLYHINFSLSQTITLVIVSFLVNIASIGLPSAASFFSPITTLFEALALPSEMIAVLFAIDTIPDMTEGVANVTGDMAAVAIVANYTKEIPELGEGQDDLIATGS
jgi:Na+/H+-dicarboxylate symporter